MTPLDTRLALTRREAGLAAGLLALGLASPARAQGFPQRPITLVVPFAAGGGTDVLARAVAGFLQERLGQPVVVENRGGGGGVIGAQGVARARPDGHTLLFVTSTFVTAASGERQLPYDVVKGFTPIALLGQGPLLVVVNKETGITTIPELIAAAKLSPDRLNYVSAGPGSINHLAGELFCQRTAVRMTHVPYKGSGPATLDLIAGQAQLFFATVPTILGHLKGDKVRLLAVTGRERSRLFPDTPTVMEAGVPDYEVATWWGVVGPAGMPAELVALLNRTINDATAGPALAQRFEEEGAEAFRGDPADLGARLETELKRWREVVRTGGLTFE